MSSVLGRRQIDRLARDDVVRECEQRGIATTSLDLGAMRKRLKCARFCTPRVLEDLACPVCRSTPHPDDVLIVCGAGHHMCFACILGIYRLAPARHVCPMRCGELRVAPPGHLLRCLVQGVGAHVLARRCAVHAQYLALHGSDFFQQLPLAHRRLYGPVELRKFAQLQDRHGTELERFIRLEQRCQILRNQLLTALQPGENPEVDPVPERVVPGARRPSHVRFPSSSSSSSSSAESSSSGSDAEVEV